MGSIDADTLFERSVSQSTDVLMQELPDEETIFLNLSTESYFGLDRTATRMYRALVEGATIGEAYQRLLPQFEVEPDRLRQDLQSLVERLVAHGLVQFKA